MNEVKPKVKMGRPPGLVPPGPNYNLRLRPEERRTLEAQAQAAGVSLAEYIRRRALGK